jgi:nitronate monooxygenase
LRRESRAGGHVAGQVSTMVLLPRIVDAVAPDLVLAAGGLADARGLAAALCLGADGAVMGTRLLATPEANAHAAYKAKLVAASEEDTVRTVLFGNGWPHSPHRTLRTPFVSEWVDRESETQDSRPEEPLVGRTVIAGTETPVQRFVSIPPNAHATERSNRWLSWPASRWVSSTKFSPPLKSFGKQSTERRG